MDRMILDDYPDILKPNEIMDILQVSRGICYELLRSGAIPSFRIGKLYRIVKKDFIGYLDASCSNHKK